MTQKTPRISRWRYWTGLIVLIVLFSVVIAFALGRLQAYIVATESMEPTIRPGDHLLVYMKKNTLPGRGDVVALRNPKNPGDKLCKRVVALPNDVVEIRDGFFYLNGARQNYRTGPKNEPMLVANKKPMKLKTNEYYVLGDNRGTSYDSSDESFGNVHGSHFIGRVLMIYWPLRRFTALKSPVENRMPISTAAHTAGR